MNETLPPAPPSPPMPPVPTPPLAAAPYQPPRSEPGPEAPSKGSIVLGIVLGFAIPIGGLLGGGFLGSLVPAGEMFFLLLLAGVPIAGLAYAFIAFARSGKTRTIGGMLIGLGILSMLVVACFSMLAGVNFH